MCVHKFAYTSSNAEFCQESESEVKHRWYKRAFSRNVRISYSWVRCSLEPHKANYSRNTELGRTCSSGAEIWMGIQAGGARIQPQQEFYVPTGYVLAHRVQ